MVKTPLAAKMRWTATSTVFESGVPVRAKLTAKVSPQELVSVPAGHFMAWPITYSLKASAKGKTRSTASTTWFAPYIGTVKSKDSTINHQFNRVFSGGGDGQRPSSRRHRDLSGFGNTRKPNNDKRLPVRLISGQQCCQNRQHQLRPNPVLDRYTNPVHRPGHGLFGCGNRSYGYLDQQ